MISGGKRKEISIGAADDFLDADGVKILTYFQAQELARKWYADELQKARGGYVAPENYTVGEAVEEYLQNYAREGKGLASTRATMNAHILRSPLAKIEVARLTTRMITEWHSNLASIPARLRTSKKSEDQNSRTRRTDEETTRRRRATANRVLTMLKAALNFAWREGKTPSDTEWRRVKPFKNVDAPVIRYLSEAECKRLVNACQPDFRNMVKAALFTGCRYSELANLRASDFDADAGTIVIRISKSGKPRHAVLTNEARAFFVDMTAGKDSKALIFSHDGLAWGKSHQSRAIKEACETAQITPAISFHILRHTHGSILAMKGVPLPVIAKQLGHADTRMTEKHYAHLSPNYVADTIRQKFPQLGLLDEKRPVEPMKPKDS